MGPEHQVDPVVRRRVFVVGVPRSGTTLVQSLLAAHSQVTSFTESHFFSRHFRPLSWWPHALLTHDPLPRAEEFLKENGSRENGSDEHGLDGDQGTYLADLRRGIPPKVLRPLASRRVARKLLDLLDWLAIDRGASTWVEKTPAHLRYLPLLEGLAEEGQTVHCVHVVRQGLEVVASLHTASRQWDRAYDLATCVTRWNHEVALSLHRLRRPRRPGVFDHGVTYEALTTRPEETLARLLDALGLPWEDGILERHGESAGRLVTPAEVWKQGVERVVRPSATSHQVLTDRQRTAVRAGLRNDLYRRVERLLEARRGPRP